MKEKDSGRETEANMQKSGVIRIELGRKEETQERIREERKKQEQMDQL